MKIVYLRSNPVNPDSRVEKEINSLLKEGYEVKAVAWDRNKKYKIRKFHLILENGSVDIYRCGIPACFGGGVKKNLIPLIKFQIILFKWLFIHRNEYDVIHACDFDTAFTAYIFTKIFKKKLVYDIFDYYIDSFSVPFFLKNVIKKLDSIVINCADAVIICSEQRKHQISGTNPKQLVIIHNTPKQYFERTNYFKLDSTKTNIAYVGILSKNRFLEEITEVIRSNLDFQFHVGGFGELENYFKEISKKYPNIIYYGKLPYYKTLDLEYNCDIMVAIYDPKVPNHIYAAPNKFYEALMLGKPIIMAKNTGMSEIVKQYNIGELIEYDKESFKLALQNLIKRKYEWNDISERMRKLYNSKYKWEIMEYRLINLYNSLYNT